MKFYCIQHSSTTDNWTEYQKCRDNNYVAMQYEYGIQENKTVSERWNRFKEIREGDVLFLQNGTSIYAWGYAISPRLKNNQNTIILNAQKIISAVDHGKYRSDKSKDCIIFSDCEVFYENLEDGKNRWGQRIDVDSWHDLRENGIPYIPSNGRGITKETTQSQAEKYIRQLSGNPNFKFKEIKV